jgi:hypothetical protein
VCSLLRVSKAVQQAVLDACSGPGNSQLQLSLEGGAPLLTNKQGREAALHAAKAGLQRLKRLNHQARWIAKNGRLIKHLTLSGGSGLDSANEAVMSIAVRPPVQLQALTLAVTRPLQHPAALLRQVDGSHLTMLSAPAVGEDGSTAMAAAVARLHSLRSLVLSAPIGQLSNMPVRSYAAALTALTKLTELSLNLANPIELVHCLPSSVAKLQLGGTPTASPAVMQQLAELQQLQQLELKTVTCDAAALEALSGLTGLRYLSLGYCFGRGQEDEAPAEALVLPGWEGPGQQDHDENLLGEEDDDEEDSSEEDDDSWEETSSDDVMKDRYWLQVVLTSSDDVFDGEDDVAAAAAAAAERYARNTLPSGILHDHAKAWAVLPMLQQLTISCYSLGPYICSAIGSAASITSLHLHLKEQKAEYSVAMLLEPLKQLQQLCMFDDDGGNVVATALGSLKGIGCLVWSGGGLSLLARTQLVTCSHLRRLFVASSGISDGELEVMGHYMTRLEVLGVWFGQTVSLGGLMQALSCGRFPALQQLVIGSHVAAYKEQEVRSKIAAVRPHMAVDLVHVFTAQGLRKYL